MPSSLTRSSDTDVWTSRKGVWARTINRSPSLLVLRYFLVVPHDLIPSRPGSLLLPGGRRVIPRCTFIPALFKCSLLSLFVLHYGRLKKLPSVCFCTTPFMASHCRCINRKVRAASASRRNLMSVDERRCGEQRTVTWIIAWVRACSS